MSQEHAPLYVRAHDVAVVMHALGGRWTTVAERCLGRALLRETHSLLTGVALGLSFPRERAAHQRQADEAIERLRVLLRVAEAGGLVRPGAARHIQDELVDMGKMMGGWRKRERLRAAARRRDPSGEEPTRPGGA